MPMHWGSLWADDAEVNALTHPESCPASRQPELKACAVQVKPIAIAEAADQECLPQTTSIGSSV
ncbi:hypothetical protein [Leptolyngbya sp. 7M]|uniref:hypothetical protein n=1 Tax=Leptolyngbya sp. 7M TaxID=2812896 RepID=UPI001B8C5252|nr:hypothetical protein [Leptolyngbya sp. 7M]QYO63289.1 hypothetical protein JVX88_25640 [Leptolyngbya sp. 7M]